jgi:hypothetical protein
VLPLGRSAERIGPRPTAVPLPSDLELASTTTPPSSRLPPPSSTSPSYQLGAMVRISIPTLPQLATPYVSPHAELTVAQAAAHVASFLQRGRGRTLVVTGAGVSVDSGIKAYRGHDGCVGSLSESSLVPGVSTVRRSLLVIVEVAALPAAASAAEARHRSSTAPCCVW